jgi:pSer/pThr/pTyr-binding forkhead associated (FHA) protein
LQAEADRRYYERFTDRDIEFPAHYPPRRFVLSHPEMSIGRCSASRGTHPQVDLSGAPEDLGISHMHAILTRQENGGYTIVDPGSSNGTTINENLTSIPVNTPVALDDGDRVHIGAWTTLTVHRGDD